MDNGNCGKCAAQELFYQTVDFSSYFEPHEFSVSEENPPDVYYIIFDEYDLSYSGIKLNINNYPLI